MNNTLIVLRAIDRNTLLGLAGRALLLMHGAVDRNTGLVPVDHTPLNLPREQNLILTTTIIAKSSTE